MPDLPNVGMERDLDQSGSISRTPPSDRTALKDISNPRHTWDGLYELWRTGRYKKLHSHALIDLGCRIPRSCAPVDPYLSRSTRYTYALGHLGRENGTSAELA